MTVTLNPIHPPASNPTAAQAKSGQAFEPSLLVGLYSDEQWERFIQEWSQCLNSKYAKVRRLSGSGDHGLDIIAFTDGAANFDQPWDSFQCKRYGHPLTPSDIWIELGKVIYFSFLKVAPFDGKERAPRSHVFVAPKDVGLTAAKLLLNPTALKEALRSNWDKYCALEKLGKGIIAPLTGQLEAYFNSFNFASFGYKSVAEIVDDHRKTAYHITRFGAAFPEPPSPMPAPANPSAEEAVFIRKLLDAYGENRNTLYSTVDDISGDAELVSHFQRQRELFYCAETLKGFARDTVPLGVFENLAEDIFHGVIDTVEGEHSCGYTRVRATIGKAADVDVSGNVLHQVARVRDRQGICHQLANEDRLTWKK